MGRREALIALYAAELSGKCGLDPDMPLLERVVDGCGPTIFVPDGGIVDVDSPAELARIRRNFLVRKLALPDGHDLPEAIRAAVEMYGAAGDPKYRAVLYYMLVVQLGAEARHP
ncbi:DUF2853 family protein [Defluviimonas sp. WL0002]|uniref:DUF2853 family protein n=1 Tax=Albidovulum marisflavi TaxID=2984159 RepID=A0ABT2Z8A1_9RHOB|nr:DUF2853 family protein [Defluviimonas sp. WL0002]MCV2867250.1 DUF2853 family protein [Defluviimonas sp. WL0002]